MKISKFNKFHKNRGIYENTIMEPVEDVTVDVGQPQSQAQMRKSQDQRSIQAQAPKMAQTQPVQYTNDLSGLAEMLGVKDYTGSGPLNYKYTVDTIDGQENQMEMKIERYSENDHFAVDGKDTKTSDVTKAKMYIDKLVADTKVKPQTPTKPIAPPMPKETPDQKPVVTPAKAQGSQMAQEPKMIGERRSNKKNSKNRVNELTENPYMRSGGMTNIGGGHTGDTKDLFAKSQEVSAMEPIDKYLRFINLLSNSKVDKNAVEMILQDCYNLLTKVV
jgi:hypothetical protein